MKNWDDTDQAKIKYVPMRLMSYGMLQPPYHMLGFLILLENQASKFFTMHS